MLYKINKERGHSATDKNKTKNFRTIESTRRIHNLRTNERNIVQKARQRVKVNSIAVTEDSKANLTSKQHMRSKYEYNTVVHCIDNPKWYLHAHLNPDLM
jgi:hypothetical protein